MTDKETLIELQRILEIQNKLHEISYLRLFFLKQKIQEYTWKIQKSNITNAFVDTNKKDPKTGPLN